MNSSLDKLKKWRKEKEESYAKEMMGKPLKSTILQVFKIPGVGLIMGKRREGKTGLAHRIGEELHKRQGVPVMVHLPPGVKTDLKKKVQTLLPDWCKVTTDKTEWETNSVVIYDEAAQTAHARRTQSGDAVELDNLIGVSGQRNQLLLFICHHSKKLDINVVREVDHIIWKRPSYAYQLFERDELSDFTMKAFDFFATLRGKRNLTEAVRRMLKKHSLVLDFEDFTFYAIENNLPSYWTEELSRLFQDITKVKAVETKAPGY